MSNESDLERVERYTRLDVRRELPYDYNLELTLQAACRLVLALHDAVTHGLEERPA